jgi:hypothetical protein
VNGVRMVWCNVQCCVQWVQLYGSGCLYSVAGSKILGADAVGEARIPWLLIFSSAS